MGCALPGGRLVLFQHRDYQGFESSLPLWGVPVGELPVNVTFLLKSMWMVINSCLLVFPDWLSHAAPEGRLKKGEEWKPACSVAPMCPATWDHPLLCHPALVSRLTHSCGGGLPVTRVVP